jgi:hypothetical protein
LADLNERSFNIQEQVSMLIYLFIFIYYLNCKCFSYPVAVILQ